jgi:hypothetical protein
MHFDARARAGVLVADAFDHFAGRPPELLIEFGISAAVCSAVTTLATSMLACQRGVGSARAGYRASWLLLLGNWTRGEPANS